MVIIRGIPHFQIYPRIDWCMYWCIALLFACRFIALSCNHYFVKFHMYCFDFVTCRLHGDVVALLFACSFMSLSCLGLMLNFTGVVSAPSLVDSLIVDRFYSLQRCYHSVMFPLFLWFLCPGARGLPVPPVVPWGNLSILENSQAWRCKIMQTADGTGSQDIIRLGPNPKISLIGGTNHYFTILFSYIYIYILIFNFHN